jgi:hypothetical protein
MISKSPLILTDANIVRNCTTLTMQDVCRTMCTRWDTDWQLRQLSHRYQPQSVVTTLPEVVICCDEEHRWQVGWIWLLITIAFSPRRQASKSNNFLRLCSACTRRQRKALAYLLVKPFETALRTSVLFGNRKSHATLDPFDSFWTHAPTSRSNVRRSITLARRPDGLTDERHPYRGTRAAAVRVPSMLRADRVPIYL